jgi:cysteinyl-tRNA synthetase
MFAPGEATRRFEAAMDDDLNTPDAIAALQALASEINRARQAGDARKAGTLAAELRTLGGVLGLLGIPAQEFQQLHRATGNGSVRPRILSDAGIQQRIVERARARFQRDFRESDRIRDELFEAGVTLEDKPDRSTTWRRL